MKTLRARLLFTVATLSFAAALYAAPKPVSFPCPDGSSRAALYLPPKPEAPVFILLHGLASSKNEWTPLLTEIEKKGWGALAYDARPPGTPWQLLVNDVGSALRYLGKPKN